MATSRVNFTLMQGNKMFKSIAGHIDSDVQEFSDEYDDSAPAVGLTMAGHDTYIMGPKLVLLDSFVVDLLNVDTSAQTFRLKLLISMDWEDDGTIEPEVKSKRALGAVRGESFRSMVSPPGENGNNSRSMAMTARQTSMGSDNSNVTSTYRTGKYVLRPEFLEDPLASTWNPEVVLVNAITDEEPIEAGSKFHSVQMLSGRPVVTRSVLYQPECRCEFNFSNYPFDETDMVVKFSSNKWNSEQVQFMWTHRLGAGENRRVSNFSNGGGSRKNRRESSFLKRSVDEAAVGGVGLSEFEIIKVRVETDEKDVNSMQRYDNAEGAFSQAHLIIRVRRDPYSYLLRVASVAELLMFLEVLSFLTDCGDLSARFSISGTIFLAMVSLYGPMADALPKVSVVTRVDKWHLYNFFLLFASNVENLMAFLLLGIVNEKVLQYTEALLGILYLYAVVKNLIWFIKPLKEREENMLLKVWLEDKIDWVKEKIMRLPRKVIPKKRKFGQAVKAAIRMKRDGVTFRERMESPPNKEKSETMDPLRRKTD